MVSATRAFRAQLISKYVIVGDGALALGVIAEALQRQRLEVGALLLEHGLDLAPGAAVDARRRPPGFPLLQEGVLLFDGLEAAALERGALRVLNCVLDRALAVVESNFVCNTTANLSARSSLSNFSENLQRNQILRQWKVNLSAKFLRKANLSAICRLHRGRRDAEDRSKIRVVAEAQSRNGDARLLVE